MMAKKKETTLEKILGTCKSGIKGAASEAYDIARHIVKKPFTSAAGLVSSSAAFKGIDLLYTTKIVETAWLEADKTFPLKRGFGQLLISWQDFQTQIALLAYRHIPKEDFHEYISNGYKLGAALTVAGGMAALYCAHRVFKEK